MGVCRFAVLYCCFKVATAASKAAAAADLAPVYFDADLSHLQAARQAARLPLMRRQAVSVEKESTPHPPHSLEGIETSTHHAANANGRPIRKSSRSHNRTTVSSPDRRLSASFARLWAYASRHWSGSHMLIPSALAERMEAATLTSRISVGGVCLMIILIGGLSCYFYHRHLPLENAERRENVPCLPLPLSSADSDLDTQAKGGGSRKQSTTTVPPTSDGVSATSADESDGSFTPAKPSQPSTAQASRASSSEQPRTAQSSKETPEPTPDRLSSPEPERTISTPQLQVIKPANSPRSNTRK